MPTINRSSSIQIGGPEKSQCGIKPEASSAHNHHGASILHSLSSPPLKPQFRQQLPYHPIEQDASEGHFSLDESVMHACAQFFVDAGDSSLARSGSQFTLDAFP